MIRSSIDESLIGYCDEPNFLQHFASISDPRIERCKKHNLLDILFLAISAVMSGCEGWEDIENFGHIKLDWLRQCRPFEAGIPRHDTIARVICRLKPAEIEKAFQAWISSLLANCRNRLRCDCD